MADKVVSSVSNSTQDVISNSGGATIICYNPTMITSNGIWQQENPLSYALPLFILQLTLVVITTRSLFLLLKPLRQPRVVADILGGVILGPSLLGRYERFATSIFPLKSVTVMETLANLGLLYFLFLVGVELDLNMIRKTGQKALIVALSGMTLPFLVGSFTSLLMKHFVSNNVPKSSFLLFLGVALSLTAFPVVARILAELKLLNTELGRLAMSSAIINDICAWILLALALSLADDKTYAISSIWVVLSGCVFVAACIFLIRPAMEWVVRKTPEGEPVNDSYICLILAAVMACGLITDAIGLHAIFGAFVFGLVIPNGPIATALIDKLEDFVSGLLLPLFFAVSGLRTDVSSINKDAGSWGVMIAVTVVACVGKVSGTLAISLYYQMPIRDGLALGLLMNTKGLIEMIVLNVGRDQQVLDVQTFSIMVLATVVTTSMIVPLVMAVYRPARQLSPYKRRTIEYPKPDSELRILVCIHTPRNVHSIINLLEASHSNNYPVCIYALHLVELTGRASAMLIVHSNNHNNSSTASTTSNTRNHLNRTQVQSEQIIQAFESYEESAINVSVHPLTAISPYSTMYEDICNLAEDKRVALIILPFHMQQTVDGTMEAVNSAYRTINHNVLSHAPCSVGILVDRGFGGATTNPSNSDISHRIAMLFLGGPDDREALLYAARMAEKPGIILTVLRFLLVAEATVKSTGLEECGSPKIQNEYDCDKEKEMDDATLSRLRLKSNSNNGEDLFIYKEREVKNGEETVSTIREMENMFDLIIVGRNEGKETPMTEGLIEWSECPELGAIGDILASSDFMTTASILIVQQYQYVGLEANGEEGLQQQQQQQQIELQPTFIGRTND